MYTPRYGDIYYYITDLCKVTYYTWKDMELDWKYRNVGNCFKTMEDAEAIAEKFKKLLKISYEKAEENS